MNETLLNKATTELSAINPKNASKRAAWYAKTAHQAIFNAYGKDWKTGKFFVRENASEFKMTKANDILNAIEANGTDYVVNGAGRVIVERK